MPVISPVIGGFLTDRLGWRYLFMGLSGLGIIAALATFFLLPETLDGSSLKRSFNPIKPLKLLLVPSIGLTILSTSLNYGGSSLMLSQFSIEAKQIHHLRTWEVGLCLAPYGLGTIFGNLVSGKLSDTLRVKFGAKGYLFIVISGILGYTATVFIFGQFVETNFVVAVICTFFVGFFITLTYPAALVFAIEQQPQNPSAVAAAFQISYLPSVRDSDDSF